jgi:hypothetical protein
MRYLEKPSGFGAGGREFPVAGSIRASQDLVDGRTGACLRQPLSPTFRRGSIW